MTKSCAALRAGRPFRSRQPCPASAHRPRHLRHPRLRPVAGSLLPPRRQAQPRDGPPPLSRRRPPLPRRHALLRFDGEDLLLLRWATGVLVGRHALLGFDGEGLLLLGRRRVSVSYFARADLP